MAFRWTTAGEAHGAGLAVILEGMPAGLAVGEPAISEMLRRRRVSSGRGPRMRDRVEKVTFLSGLVGGTTIGSPIAILIGEVDEMGRRAGGISELRPFTVPRPGHADLAGSYKYGTTAVERVWERASARETAARVAAGAVCLELLGRLGIAVGSYTTAVGEISCPGLDEVPPIDVDDEGARCPDAEADARMRALIEEATREGDSLGGRCRAVATGLPPGIGGFGQWDERLGTRVAAAMMSIPSVKGVLIGPAEAGAGKRGSEFIDPIEKRGGAVLPAGNASGGIEGGMTNGMPVVVELMVKPVPTLGKPLASVDLASGEPAPAPALRADVCVVPTVGVIAEAMLALELTRALLEQFGGDTVDDVAERLAQFKRSRGL